MQQRSKYLVFTADYLLPAIFVLVILISYLVAFHTQVFSIQAVDCKLDYQPCNNPAILAELGKLEGENLLTYQSAQLKSRLLSGEYTLRAVEFHKLYPRTLQVSLLSTYPVVALQVAGQDGKYLTLDERRRFIAVREQDPNVPTLTINSLPPFQLGQTLQDERLLKAIDFVLLASTKLLPISAYSLDEQDTLTLTLNSGQFAILTLNESGDSQLTTLQTVLASPAISADFHTIDVRYSQPVLK